MRTTNTKSKTLKDVSDVMWRVYFGTEKLTVLDQAKLCPRDVTLFTGLDGYRSRFQGNELCIMLTNNSFIDTLITSEFTIDFLVINKDFIFYEDYRLSTEEIFNDYKLFNTKTLYDSTFTDVLEEALKFEFRFDKIRTYIFRPNAVKRFIGT